MERVWEGSRDMVTSNSLSPCAPDPHVLPRGSKDPHDHLELPGPTSQAGAWEPHSAVLRADSGLCAQGSLWGCHEGDRDGAWVAGSEAGTRCAWLGLGLMLRTGPGGGEPCRAEPAAPSGPCACYWWWGAPAGGCRSHPCPAGAAAWPRAGAVPASTA